MCTEKLRVEIFPFPTSLQFYADYRLLKRNICENETSHLIVLPLTPYHFFVKAVYFECLYDFHYSDLKYLEPF